MINIEKDENFFIDFKQLFSAYNRTKKHKLRKRDKDKLELLIYQQFQLHKLKKALEAGNNNYIKSSGGLVGGGPLQVEPLDTTFKYIRYSEKINIHPRKKARRRRKNEKRVRR